MKVKVFFSSIIAILIIGFSFGQTKQIDVKKSKIEWVGKKVAGQHNGDLKFKSGSVVLKNNVITGGSFVINMATINTLDLEGEYKGKLDGHLKAEDFFGVDKYPTAKLVFKKINNSVKGKQTITADLTIKGITKPVTFDLVSSKNSATAKFNIDRTLYGIKYGSGSFFDGLGDKAIDNEFEVNVNIVF